MLNKTRLTDLYRITDISNTTMRQLKIAPSITKRDGEILDKYLQEIGREEMLTPDQEVELARRIHEGDRKALDRLVRANLRFVVSVAKQYQNQGMALPDLINEGNLGLIKAAEKFDETRGFKFISYAVWWIRQSILQALAEQGRVVRLPLNRIGELSKIRKAMATFEQENHRRPSVDELAMILDVPAEKISEALQASGQHASLDEPLAEDGSTTMADKLSYDDAPGTDSGLNQESLSRDMARVLQQLPEREREILMMVFGIGSQELTMEEIGAKFNLSRERVRQIKEKAISTLRGSKSSLLQSYLG